ncbi:MAG: hypothetical protein N3A55_10410 [Methylohalobius sp.]|nr:hypothetical protein [Methylohalobius sp.]
MFLVFLSALQACSPLLHAHLGPEHAPSVLHLPGLERYYHSEPEAYQSSSLPSDEGVVVRSDDGVCREIKTLPILALVLFDSIPPFAEPQIEKAGSIPAQASPFQPRITPPPRAPPV